MHDDIVGALVRLRHIDSAGLTLFMYQLYIRTWHNAIVSLLLNSDTCHVQYRLYYLNSERQQGAWN